MDIKCTNCGEPWDAWELVDEGREACEADGFTFGQNVYVIYSCPACKGQVELSDQNSSFRRMATNALADVLGDDMDGLASELDDLDV